MGKIYKALTGHRRAQVIVYSLRWDKPSNLMDSTIREGLANKALLEESTYTDTILRVFYQVWVYLLILNEPRLM